MVEMELKSVVMGGGPIPSVIVLKPAGEDPEADKEAPVVVAGPDAQGATATPALDELPIGVGTFEAACIASGVTGGNKRPMTHDLLCDVLGTLGGELESVSITRVEGSMFYATLDLRDAEGAEHHVDARPSDAVALAVRVGVPILASEDVLERAGSPDFDAIAKDEKSRELREFHDFVEKLDPSDFKAHDKQ